MALAAGFEPANPFELPVFKTGGLNRTLPSKHIKVVATKLRMATQNITTMFFRKKIKSKYKHSPFEKKLSLLLVVVRPLGIEPRNP